MLHVQPSCKLPVFRPTRAPQVRIGQWAQVSEPAQLYDTRQAVATLAHPQYQPADVRRGSDVALLLLDAPSSRVPARLPPFTRERAGGGPRVAPPCKGGARWASGWHALPCAACTRLSKRRLVSSNCCPLAAAKPGLPVAAGTVLAALGWGANGEEGIAGTDALQEVCLQLVAFGQVP